MPWLLAAVGAVGVFATSYFKGRADQASVPVPPGAQSFGSVQLFGIAAVIIAGVLAFKAVKPLL